MTDKPGRRRARGEGSIWFSEARQRWCGRLDLGWQEGKRKHKDVWGRTQREVQVKLADARRRHEAGLRVDLDQQTVQEYLERWLKWKSAHVRPRTGHTYECYLTAHIYPAIGKHRLRELRVDQVQGMLDKRAKELSPSTVKHIRDILRGALNDAIRWGELERNVGAHARPPEQKPKPVRPLTRKQARALLEATAGHPRERLIRFALSMGMRRSEILGLPRTAVDLEAGTLKVTQGLQRSPGKGLVLEEPKSAMGRREIPLPGFVVELLREERKAQATAQVLAANHWHETGYVFTDEFGRPFSPDRISHEFKALAVKAGLPDLTFHSLRHAAAAILIAQDVPLTMVQEILGHATYATTKDIYGHLAADVKQLAADAMDKALSVILSVNPDEG